MLPSDNVLAELRGSDEAGILFGNLGGQVVKFRQP